MPTGKRSPGWRIAYETARRAADRRLRDQHLDEWRGYFEQERNHYKATRPDEYAAAWAAGETRETEKEQEKAE